MTNTNIINFYMLANKLKSKIRTGWMEIGIEKERLESVSEHIYGCLILSIAIDSEYNLNLDMLKVFKMLILHETEEILMGDLTLRSKTTPEEKLKLGKKCVHDVVKDLIKASEIEELLDEFNERKTNVSKFCYRIDKIECDFQAKIYDLEGVFDIEKAREDLKYYGNKAKLVEEKAKTASDYWIEFDKFKFEDDPIFKSLIEDIQKIEEIKNG